MLDAIESSWAPSRWAVIRDARRRQRRRQRRLLAVAAALMVAAALARVIDTNSGTGQAPTPPPVKIGRVAQLDLGGVVEDATTLDGNVWVLTCLRRCSDPSSSAIAGQLIEVAANGHELRRFPVSDPTALAAGGGAIWLAHFGTGEISRVDPRTGMASATLHLQFARPIATNGWRRFEPLAISYGAGRVWASDALGYVAEINPRTLRVQRLVFTSSEAPSTATAAGLTWIADELTGIGAFPANSNHVATYPISWARQPVDVGTVASGAGLIWAMGTETNYSISLTDPPTVGVLTTLDPHTGRIVEQWRISSRASGLVLGGGGAYVSDDDSGRLLRLIARHGVQFFRVPDAAKLTAVTANALWAITPHGQLLRIGLAQR